MGFYKNVLMGFSGLLVVLLVMMAVMMSDKTNLKTYPAEKSKCPDFYSLSSKDSCVMTQSVYSSRAPECVTMFPTRLTDEDKKLWATSCGVAWDGITNSSII